MQSEKWFMLAGQGFSKQAEFEALMKRLYRSLAWRYGSWEQRMYLLHKFSYVLFIRSRRAGV